MPGRQGQMSREGHPVWRKEVETESREKTSEPRRDAGRVLPASANATCPLRLLLVYIWGHGHTFSNITDVVSKAQTVAPCGLCPGTTPRSLAACLDHRVCGPGSSWPRCGPASHLLVARMDVGLDSSPLGTVSSGSISLWYRSKILLSARIPKNSFSWSSIA